MPARALGIASLVLPSLAALRFRQKLDHRGGSNNPGGFIPFQGEGFLAAGHEELGLAEIKAEVLPGAIREHARSAVGCELEGFLLAPARFRRSGCRPCRF